MVWIESHAELANNPKTRKLAQRLDVSIPTAVGLLHMLWWWAMSYAKDGNLSRHDTEDIAIGIQWEGDPQKLLDALAASRFVDETQNGLALHDWHEYGGKFIERTERDRARKADAREAKRSGNSGDVQRTSNGQDADIQGTAHVDNNTKPNKRYTTNITNTLESVRTALLNEGFDESDIDQPLIDLESELTVSPGRLTSPVAWAKKKAKVERQKRRAKQPKVKVIDGVQSAHIDGSWKPVAELE